MQLFDYVNRKKAKLRWTAFTLVTQRGRVEQYNTDLFPSGQFSQVYGASSYQYIIAEEQVW